MELIFRGRKNINNPVDLVCISSENQIYTPNVFTNSPFYLKQGSVVWVKRDDVYNVYELTEDITEQNEEDFIQTINKLE